MSIIIHSVLSLECGKSRLRASISIIIQNIIAAAMSNIGSMKKIKTNESPATSFMTSPYVLLVFGVYIVLHISLCFGFLFYIVLFCCFVHLFTSFINLSASLTETIMSKSVPFKYTFGSELPAINFEG